jgi:hypothetical protein
MYYIQLPRNPELALRILKKTKRVGVNECLAVMVKFKRFPQVIQEAILTSPRTLEEKEELMHGLQVMMEFLAEKDPDQWQQHLKSKYHAILSSLHEST